MTDVEDQIRRYAAAIAVTDRPVELSEINSQQRGRARTPRSVRQLVVAIGVVIVAVSVGAVVAFRNPSPVPVGGSSGPRSSTGHVASLKWTRVAAPQMLIERIVNANGHTYALGTDNAGAVVDALSADGALRTVFHEANTNGLSDVSDLVGVFGELVAVGSDAGGAAAWRSTDDGVTWRRVAVEQPPVGGFDGHFFGAVVSIARVVVVRGKLYAFGQSAYTATNGECPQAAWTSTDGARFELASRNNPIACGGSDATNGPAGLVSIEQNHSLAIVDGVEHVITPGSNNSVNAIASDAHGYVAVGAIDNRGDTASPGAIWWSANGKNWTRVVTASAPGPKGFARFTGVVHTQAGWIAVGYQTHLGANEKVNDAILWTSTDGQHWTNDTRDDGTFEQFAQANGIGVTDDGFAIFGDGNITGGRIATDPLAQDPVGQDSVLWFGSNTPAGKPLGIVEGTMSESGGPAPGVNLRVTGSLTATGTDGSHFAATVGVAGRFSTQLPPGTYHVVGHSPTYGNGTYDCEAGGPVTVRAYTVTHIELTCPLK